MNKINRVTLFSLCAMFVACSEYNPTDLTVKQVETINEYTRNFVARYGEIDPNHTWGFGNVMYTRTEVNANDYGKPAPIDTAEDENGKNEIDRVLAVFQGKKSSETSFNWGNYFIQHVYSDTKDAVYFAGKDYKSTKDYTKTNDSNNGSGLNSKNWSSYYDDNGFGYALFTNMGYKPDNTEQFGFVDSEGNVHTNNYIILLIDGSFYVGFDFSGNEDYTDWIVKLTPTGIGSTDTPRKVRIMCEDLGSTSDFDFNDIVFDVDLNSYYSYQENDNTKYGVTITVQAAGGTLPVYIGSANNRRNEVHAILSKSTSADHSSKTYTPINVGKGDSYLPQEFVVTGLSSNNPADIPLYRESSDNHAIIELIPHNTNETAPFKICVPVGTRWTKENKDIGDAYKGFDDWVQDEGGNTNEWGDGAGSKTPAWVDGDCDPNLLMDSNPQEK